MKRTAELGFLLAVALILSYVESLLPLTFGIPGIKLGLPNLVVVLLLYNGKKSLTGAREAVLVNGMRIILSGFLFGSLYSILYALAGAALSLMVMVFAKKCSCFSMLGVSVLGGVFHNVGQIIVAMFVVETFAVLYYLPFLIISGVVTGALLGLVGMETQPYLQRHDL